MRFDDIKAGDTVWFLGSTGAYSRKMSRRTPKTLWDESGAKWHKSMRWEYFFADEKSALECLRRIKCERIAEESTNLEFIERRLVEIENG